MTHVSGWRVVVPVKGGDEAKSRLALPAPARRALATAMALDCLEAALATAGVDCVVCVSDDPVIARLARGVGAATAAAGRPGLAAAVDAGLAVLAPGPAAVLLGDLPALRPEELERALAAAAACPVPVVVADADGGGSVLVADRDGRPPHRFGPSSARAHVAAGARALPAAGPTRLPSLRRDVDTLDALAEALALGVGARTRAALAETAVALP
ncbi:2-phospho-L-lactate guanylyltransferase [Kineococcus sp. SYSU DK006]|uniref:2-phospho-L-lactate guanylyltransferase n=1 Tax=Kineococcus sp. SYSU DK006 TaxID=3383127 RepID=UPI003D7DAC60